MQNFELGFVENQSNILTTTFLLRVDWGNRWQPLLLACLLGKVSMHAMPICPNAGCKRRTEGHATTKFMKHPGEMCFFPKSSPQKTILRWIGSLNVWYLLIFSFSLEFRKFGDVIQLLTYCFRSCNRIEWLKPGRSFRGVKQSLTRWLDHTYGYPVGLSPRRLFHVVSLIFNLYYIILLLCPDFLVLNHESFRSFF